MRDMLEQDIAAAMDEGIRQRAMPGGVVCLARGGNTILHRAWGHSYLYDTPTTLAHDPLPARDDGIYDIASLTKLFTATRVLQLVEEGHLELDRRVATYLPEFAAGGKERVTVRHLLTHTSGFAAGMPLHEIHGGREERLQAVFQASLVAAPGATYCYSDLGFITLGALSERLGGRPLDEQVARHIADPLHLSDTCYRPHPRLRDRVAPTEFSPGDARGPSWGTVHDENAASLGGVAGHAGLFSTAADIARFGELFLRDGILDGVRVVQTQTVRAMRRLQTPTIPAAWRGLGFYLNQQHFMGELASPDTFGHTGFTGTSIVIDPRRDLVLVILTNRVHPSRQEPRINAVRVAVADAVARAFPLT